MRDDKGHVFGFSQRLWVALIGLPLLAFPLFGQEDEPTRITPGDRFWISGQANFITQYHPSFRSPYASDNSLRGNSEHATSRVLTLYTGIRLFTNTDVLFDVESAGGGGLSDALGLGGFTNLDVVRNPTLGSKPYVARVMIHQTIPLSRKYAGAARSPLSLAPVVPERRIEFRIGKMSTVDLFDLNSIGSDSHLQFMNWVADNSGAYDYAADTRGYTYGIVAEYYDKNWAFRYGTLLMPKIANGIHLDLNLARARGDNFELELHPALVEKRATVLRLLTFVNHANMGSYRESIQSAGNDVPDVTDSRRQSRVKYGFGANTEQEVTKDLRLFGRFGWNEGHNESFAYTEVDQSLAFGADLRGKSWKRGDDKAAVAVLVDALSGDHRQYLARGGQGFLLGDGALNYGREKIIEAYYNFHLWRGVSLSFNVQRIWNPGYNRDRGPVIVPSFRLHIEDAVPFAR